MTSRYAFPHRPDLAAWRNKSNISLAAIEAATKIGARYLRAIEAGEFHSLPGGIYGLSYVRQYARAIDYEEEELVEYYRGIVDPEEPAPAAPARWTGRLLARVRAPLFPTGDRPASRAAMEPAHAKSDS